jgi:hypothetical protein
MGEIIIGAGAILSAILSAAASVAGAVMAVVSWVVNAAVAVASAVYAAAAAVYTAISGTIASAYSAIAGWVGSAISAVSESLIVAWEYIGYYVLTIQEGFAAFLEVIQFDLILTVHEIAYLVSEEYREMITAVWREISEVSKALGFAPEVLNLAFRNSRALVLSASALMGKSYDIAEITWLNSFNEYMEEFAALAHKYENDPAALYYDLDKWLIKPAVNVAADMSRTILQTMKDVIGTLDITLTKINEFRTDIDKLIAGMPSAIRVEMLPLIKPLEKAFDEFILYNYEPTMEAVKGLTDKITEGLNTHEERMGSLVDRLKKPGDYLGEIDRLSYEERLEQEDRVSEISTRPYRRQIEVGEVRAQTEFEEFLKMLEALKVEITPPPYHVEEAPGPIRPALAPAVPRNTWFVGDF